MYSYSLHQQILQYCHQYKVEITGKDSHFYARLMANTGDLSKLYSSLYLQHPYEKESFAALMELIVQQYAARSNELKNSDNHRISGDGWYLSHQLAGMSLYVDRFCGKLSELSSKLSYFRELGVNLLHLMPLFESPEAESDGGYAISDFRKIKPALGDLGDLHVLEQEMRKAGMYLMLDIVLNHCSQQHTWAQKARQGDPYYQEYFYFFKTREIPDRFDAAMPDIFPESSPGNFTWIPECRQWVMTVFHQYQWDLNYSNPRVLVEVLSNIFFYANLGVDLLRLDAPAFIWKEPGTSCQNLPKAHTLLQMMRLATEIACPGMALLAEAIVSPRQIMQYFGSGHFEGKEAQLAYNATHMALQWDALATGKTGVMMAAQPVIAQKPRSCTWINYTRCHDDIGLGYEDEMIEKAGYNPYAHRNFMKEYYAGVYAGSTSSGALFSVNPKNEDARISGSLASLCGLEKAISAQDETAIALAIQKILLMQAHCIFLGGIPMLYYGDEAGYTNDYAYVQDAGRNYDNRWMHRPIIDWKKNERRKQQGTIENRIYSATQKLLKIRQSLELLNDDNNTFWLDSHNFHIASYVRTAGKRKLYCLFNFSARDCRIAPGHIIGNEWPPGGCYDHWSGKRLLKDLPEEPLLLSAYSFCLLDNEVFK